MYLHLELKHVPSNRQTEAIERLSRLHGLMAASPGFQDAQICAYLGNPSLYLVVRSWQDAAAHATYRASEAAREFAQDRPAVLPWENAAVQEWEAILTLHGQSSGDYLVRTLYSVAQGRWQTFVEDRGRHDSRQSEAAGFVCGRSYRPLKSGEDTPGEVLVLERYADRESYNRYLESPERAEYERRMDPTIGPLQLVECYAVVAETRAR
jgi:heme-degrading monooxygenase HmoA